MDEERSAKSDRFSVVALAARIGWRMVKGLTWTLFIFVAYTTYQSFFMVLITENTDTGQGDRPGHLGKIVIAVFHGVDADLFLAVEG